MFLINSQYSDGYRLIGPRLNGHAVIRFAKYNVKESSKEDHYQGLKSEKCFLLVNPEIAEIHGRFEHDQLKVVFKVYMLCKISLSQY